MAHSIGGTALATLCIEGGYRLGLADVAGSPVSIPRQTGLRTGSRTLKGRSYSLLLRVVGSSSATHRQPPYTRGQYLDYVEALGQLILNPDADGNPQEIALSRVLPTAAGSQTTSIRAIYDTGFEVEDTSAHSGVVTPRLQLLDPFWAVSGGGRRYS